MILQEHTDVKRVESEVDSNQNVSKGSKFKRIISRNLGWIIISFGISFWFIEAAVHAFVFEEDSFFQQITSPSPNEIWMRSLIICLFFVFGLYVQLVFKKTGSSDADRLIPSTSKLKPYIVLTLIIWTIVVSISLVWNIWQQHNNAHEAAKVEARTAFSKDLIYRRWASGHGGVYVPATDQTPPNPYLSHIQERDITTPSGRSLTLVNPAYMTRQVHELAEEQYGVRGHITSLNPIRPENAPDDWERIAMESFAAGEKEVSGIAKMDDEKYMRLMRPMVTEEGCLKCHAKQGYQLGDIRGGISVSVPMKPHLAVALSGIVPLVLGHGLLWLIGVGGIGYGGRRLGREFARRRSVEKSLRKSESDIHENMRLNQILLDNMPCIAMLMHPRTREIVASNEMAAKVGAIPGKTCYGTWAQREKPCTFCQAPMAWATGQEQHLEVDYGGRSWDANWVPISDDLYMHYAFDITERKQAEEKLQLSDLRLNMVSKAGGVVVWDWNIITNELDWSNAYYRAFGYSQDDTLPTIESWTNFIHPDDAEDTLAGLQKVVKSGKTKWSAEYRFKKKDGSYAFTLDWGTVIHDEKGKPVRMIGAMLDITKRKQTEEALRESEKKSRAYLEYSPACTKIVDLDFNLQYMSRAGVEGLNINDITEFYGKPYPFDFYPESFRNTMTKNLEKVKATGEIVTQEAPVVDIDGNELWFHSTLVPVNDDQGQIDYIMVVSIETTARKRAELELRSNEKKFRSLVESTSSVIIMLSPDFNILEFNPEAERIYGKKKQEVLGKNYLEMFIPEEARILLANDIKKVLSGISTRNFENEVTIADGSRCVFSWNVNRTLNSNGEPIGIVAVGQDVTERKRIERALYMTQHSVDKAAFGVFWITEDAHFAYVNDVGCETLGYTRDELLELTVPDIDPAFDMDKWKVHWEDLKQRKNFKIETRHRRKDGSTFPAEVTINYLEYNGVGYNFASASDITERKKVEEKLSSSEERFRQATMESPFPIMIHADDGEILQINKVWTELTGYSHEEIPTLFDWTERAYGERKDVIKDRIDEIFDYDSRVDEGEYVIRSKDGQSLTWDFSSAPLGKLADGRRLVISIAKDVTQRKEIEAALYESGERLRSLMQQSPLAIELYDRDGLQIEVNEAYELLWGFPASHTVNKFNVLNSKEVEDTGLMEYVKRAYGGEAVQVPEYKFDSRGETEADGQGRVRWLSTRIYPLKDNQGNVKNIVITHEDITRSKESEEKIKNLARFPSEDPSPVLRIAKDGVLLYANNASKVLLRDCRYEDGKKVSEQWQKIVSDVFSKNTAKRVEMEQGERIYSFMFAPVVEAGYVNVYGRDITERKQAEERIRHHQAELEHASRLSTIGQMASELAHELNQPLGTILTQSDIGVRMMNLKGAKGDGLLKVVKNIGKQAELAGKIIRRVRDFSAKREPKRQKININDVIGEAMTFIEAEAKTYRVVPEFDLSEDIAMIMADSIQIEQVIVNLALNSFEAMSKTEHAGRKFTIQTKPLAKSNVEVIISDNGSGMPPEVAGKIFEPFFTTKDKGLGIGLSISRSIIESHGGQLKVESVVDKGTTFSFTLPAGKADIKKVKIPELEKPFYSEK